MADVQKAIAAAREAVARALALASGWDGWDTATTCAHTPSGTDPEDEREYWLGLADAAIAAIDAQEQVPPAQPVPDWLPQPGEPEYVGDAGPVSDDDFVDLDDPDVLAEFDRKIAEAHAEIERRGYERGLKDARIEMGVVLAAKAHPAPVAVPEVEALDAAIHLAAIGDNSGAAKALLAWAERAHGGNDE